MGDHIGYSCFLSFWLHEKVKILELNQPGRITAVFISTCGTEYKVAYFNNGERKECYFLAEDLTSIEEKKKDSENG